MALIHAVSSRWADPADELRTSEMGDSRPGNLSLRTRWWPLSRHSIAGACMAAAFMLAPGGCLRAPLYDRVILGGRVMDPETETDAVLNVGILGGKIVAVTRNPRRANSSSVRRYPCPNLGPLRPGATPAAANGGDPQDDNSAGASPCAAGPEHARQGEGSRGSGC